MLSPLHFGFLGVYSQMILSCGSFQHNFAFLKALYDLEWNRCLNAFDYIIILSLIQRLPLLQSRVKS